MLAKTISIGSRDGGAFDCYLVTPETEVAVPAIVLASTIRGVDADIRAIAGELAAHGLIVAAPDLFWRSIPGPLSSADDRAAQRSQPRLEQIQAGESDMVDTLAYLGALEKFNGNAAAIGFCYGGPYAVLGPKRLGYRAGISCHGSQMLDYIDELNGIAGRVCIIWGDQDSRAPIEVVDAYRAIEARMKNVEVHIFPGALHGYMMHGSEAFHPAARDFSMSRALAILAPLRGERVSPPKMERA